MTDLKKILGRRVTEILTKKNMKQCELAELLNIEPQSISRMVSGRHFPKIEHLEKIIEVLKIKPAELFTLEHVDDDKKLVDDINSLIATASSNQIRMLHKIVTAVFEQ